MTRSTGATAGARRATLAALALLSTAAAQAAPGTFTVFEDLPQFGIYVTDPPAYTPPRGVIMLNNGTRFVRRLTPAQRQLIGADVKARITYLAQCDNYDRLGSLFIVVKPAGVRPREADPLIEIARWVTPFSNYWRGDKATYTFPDADLSPFAGVLTNPALDVWIGIEGGSNPYDGDPCTTRDVTPEFRAVGFRYTVALASTTAAPAATGAPVMPVTLGDYTTVPVTGSATARQAGPGTAVVIVSGHGADNGGNEYKNTTDTLTVNGTVAGSFSTKVDCAAYRQYSPDGNPFIFLGNNGGNPRNWCPGALVPARTFRVEVQADNSVALDVSDPSVPAGSSYRTSVTLIPD